jgi:glycine cleavage system regulatory protein
MKTLILTVIGSDRPGLTQALADAVLEAGGNWLESHLAKLGGKYVGSVLVEVPDERVGALEAASRRIDAAGLSVTVLDAAGGETMPGQPLTLELVGQDRPGIVREVTAVLADLNVNIEDLVTGVENGAWSGARLFRANARLLVPDGTSQDDLRDALERISGEIMVDFSLSVLEPAGAA